MELRLHLPVKQVMIFIGHGLLGFSIEDAQPPVILKPPPAGMAIEVFEMVDGEATTADVASRLDVIGGSISYPIPRLEVDAPVEVDGGCEVAKPHLRNLPPDLQKELVNLTRDGPTLHKMSPLSNVVQPRICPHLVLFQPVLVVVLGHEFAVLLVIVLALLHLLVSPTLRLNTG